MRDEDSNDPCENNVLNAPKTPTRRTQPVAIIKDPSPPPSVETAEAIRVSLPTVLAHATTTTTSHKKQRRIRPHTTDHVVVVVMEDNVEEKDGEGYKMISSPPSSPSSSTVSSSSSSSASTATTATTTTSSSSFRGWEDGNAEYGVHDDQRHSVATVEVDIDWEMKDGHATTTATTTTRAVRFNEIANIRYIDNVDDRTVTEWNACRYSVEEYTRFRTREKTFIRQLSNLGRVYGYPNDDVMGVETRCQRSERRRRYREAVWAVKFECMFQMGYDPIRIAEVYGCYTIESERSARTRGTENAIQVGQNPAEPSVYDIDILHPESASTNDATLIARTISNHLPAGDNNKKSKSNVNSSIISRSVDALLPLMPATTLSEVSVLPREPPRSSAVSSISLQDIVQCTPFSPLPTTTRESGRQCNSRGLQPRVENSSPTKESKMRKQQQQGIENGRISPRQNTNTSSGDHHYHQKVPFGQHLGAVIPGLISPPQTQIICRRGCGIPTPPSSPPTQYPQRQSQRRNNTTTTTQSGSVQQVVHSHLHSSKQQQQHHHFQEQQPKQKHNTHPTPPDQRHHYQYLQQIRRHHHGHHHNNDTDNLFWTSPHHYPEGEEALIVWNNGNDDNDDDYDQTFATGGTVGMIPEQQQQQQQQQQQRWTWNPITCDFVPTPRLVTWKLYD